MKIKNTEVEAQYPWPENDEHFLLQGGTAGLVLRAAKRGGNYGTAFVEAFPEGTFIRGEGFTVAEAETDAWQKYQRYLSCPGHDYQARGYKNGAGFCKHCNKFASGVFSGEDLGQFCKKCGRATTHHWVGDDMYCEDHSRDDDVVAAMDARLEAARANRAPLGSATGSMMGDLFAFLESKMEEDA